MSNDTYCASKEFENSLTILRTSRVAGTASTQTLAADFHALLQHEAVRMRRKLDSQTYFLGAIWI